MFKNKRLVTGGTCKRGFGVAQCQVRPGTLCQQVLRL
jgi:hypothetical protein